jgi:hypothetical protein
MRPVHELPRSDTLASQTSEVTVPASSTGKNPIVEYLNSLRTQERDANATYVHEQRAAFLSQLRAAHPWFPADSELLVPTRLDGLGDALRDRSAFGADLVFLTGDAGDGKTALCDHVARTIAGKPIDLREKTIVGDWLIVKDASELLETELRGLVRARRKGETATGLLVAINEGRLRRIGSDLGPLWRTVIEPSLRTLYDEAEAAALEASMKRERVLVLNFRHRFHVQTVLPRLLERWTRRTFWEDSPTCSSCAARERCAIIANAAALRRDDSQRWLVDVMTNAHLAGQRLPFRRLQALLALACTGGLRCDEVGGADQAGARGPLRVLRHRFYEVLFPGRECGRSAVRREALCATLAAVDPVHEVSREVDGEILGLASPAAAEDGALSLRGRELPPLEVQALQAARALQREGLTPDDAGQMLAAVTRSLRRWAAAMQSLPQPRWKRAQDALAEFVVGGTGESLQRDIVDALNRLHGGEGRERILARQVDPAGFRDPERLALELDLKTEFEVRLVKGPVLALSAQRWLEGYRSEVLLEAWPKGHPERRERVQVDVRMLEALFAVRDGFTGLGGLGPYRRDLARFFARLGHLALEAGHAPAISLMVEQRRVGVETIPTQTGARFSFQAEH